MKWVVSQEVIKYKLVNMNHIEDGPPEGTKAAEKDPEPLVSVCITAYNEEGVVCEAIQSIINQTYQNWELILIDDGSTDETLAEMKNFSDDERIRIIQQDNQGYCASRDRGLKEADPEAEWVGFCGADDRWLPTKLEKQMIRRNTEHDVIHTDVFHIDEDGERTGRRWGSDNPIQGTGTSVAEALYMKNFVCIQSALVRQSSIPEHGFTEDLSITCDHDFWLRLVDLGGSFLYLPEPLVEKRYHGQNISGDYRTSFYERKRVASLAAERTPTLSPLKRKKMSKIYETYGINLITDDKVSDGRRALIKSIQYDWKNWESWILGFLSISPRLIERVTKAS